MHKISFYCFVFSLMAGMAMASSATLKISGDAPMGESNVVVRAAQIHYQTTDLTSVAGRSALLQRIHKVAVAVCTVNPKSHLYHNQKKITRCTEAAEKEAVSRLDLSDADSAQMLASIK